MIHGRKMVLVPHENADQMNVDIPQAPAPVASFSEMDKEMEKILKDSKIGDYEKWIRYEQVLQKYINQLNKNKRDLKMACREQSEDEQDEDDVESKADNNEQQKIPKANDLLVGFRSKTQEGKAKVLYGILDKCRDIKWDADGTTTINGAKVGNLTNLIRQSVTAKPKNSPEGWLEFKEILKKIKLPVEFINNSELKAYLKKEPQEESITPKQQAKRKATDGKPAAKKAKGAGRQSNWLNFP